MLLIVYGAGTFQFLGCVPCGMSKKKNPGFVANDAFKERPADRPDLCCTCYKNPKAKSSNYCRQCWAERKKIYRANYRARKLHRKLLPATPE